MAFLKKDWLTTPPFDYELKQYQLFDAIQHTMQIVNDGKIYIALEEVEGKLYDLYKFQSERNKHEDALKVLKGINLDTMSLEYEYPETLGEMDSIYSLSEFAIEEFEAIFKFVRATWRNLSKKVEISEIPEKRSTKKSGYVFLSNLDNTIIVYSYTPIISNTEWRTLDLKEIDRIDDDISSISSYIQNLENNENFRFWRIKSKIGLHNFNEGAFHIIKYNLFYKIVVT